MKYSLDIEKKVVLDYLRDFEAADAVYFAVQRELFDFDFDHGTSDELKAIRKKLQIASADREYSAVAVCSCLKHYSDILASADAPADAPVDVPEDASADAPEDSPADALEDSPEYAPEDSPADAPEDSPEYAPEYVPVDVLADTLVKALAHTFFNALTDAPADVPVAYNSDFPFRGGSHGPAP